METCLILEGTYPYVSGGVSTWTHNFIQAMPDVNFRLVCIMAPGGKREPRYTIPSNVVSIEHIVLQTIPNGPSDLGTQYSKAFHELERILLTIQSRPTIPLLKKLLDIFQTFQVGPETLLNSKEAWSMLTRMYRATMQHASFLDFFWSWRGLLSGMYSILLAPYPKVDIYHSFCTGYAGLLLARAKIETGKPCFLTEHGIYTNERKIEITAAEWLRDHKSMSLSVKRRLYERDLKDYWMDTFSAYSKLAYDAADKIITLHAGNIPFQLEDGANPEKIQMIPNGVDIEKFAAIERRKSSVPTIALIGRVVPIKDIKTYIRSCEIVRQKIPSLIAYIMGPTDEDPDYFAECRNLVEKWKLGSTVKFTGKVNVQEMLKEIDVVVLTSISEAQPLVLLEAGAAGIPSVATDVGSCREIILGTSSKEYGGFVVPLVNPQETADAILNLLQDSKVYDHCSKAIKQRIAKNYNKDDQNAAYRTLYSL